MLCQESIVFFFQAEDGIRDLVRSRGLGDVYKRQRLLHGLPGPAAGRRGDARLARPPGRPAARRDAGPVSYTHLTLPTSDLV